MNVDSSQFYPPRARGFGRLRGAIFFLRRFSFLNDLKLPAGLGAMILPVFTQLLISRSGWRAAYASLGGLALLLGLPLSWRYIRERGCPGSRNHPARHCERENQQRVAQHSDRKHDACIYAQFLAHLEGV